MDFSPAHTYSHSMSVCPCRVAKEMLLSLGCTPKVYNKMEAKIASEIRQLTTMESVLKSSIPAGNPSDDA